MAGSMTPGFFPGEIAQATMRTQIITRSMAGTSGIAGTDVGPENPLAVRPVPDGPIIRPVDFEQDALPNPNAANADRQPINTFDPQLGGTIDVFA